MTEFVFVGMEILMIVFALIAAVFDQPAWGALFIAWASLWRLQTKEVRDACRS